MDVATWVFPVASNVIAPELEQLLNVSPAETATIPPIIITSDTSAVAVKVTLALFLTEL